MLDIRSTNSQVTQDRRNHPRLELHCSAVVWGVNGIVTVTDISLGGMFIEPQEPTIVEIGQVADVRLNLPEENRCIQVKVRFVNQNKRGIGCQYVALSPENEAAIKECIEVFSNTLPIRLDETVKSVQITKNNQAIFVCPRCKKKKTVNASRYIKPNQTIKVKSKCSCGHAWTSSLGEKRPVENLSQAPDNHKRIIIYPSSNPHRNT